MITVTGSRARVKVFPGWILQSVYAEKYKKGKTRGLQFTSVVFVFTWHTIHSCSKSKSTIWLFFFLSTVVCFLLMWRKTLCCSSCNWLIIFYSGNTNPLPPVGVVVTTGRMCLTAGWDCKGAYDIIVSKKKKKKAFGSFCCYTKPDREAFYTVSAWSTLSKMCSFGLAGFVQTQKWNNREFDHFQWDPSLCKWGQNKGAFLFLSSPFYRTPLPICQSFVFIYVYLDSSLLSELLLFSFQCLESIREFLVFLLWVEADSGTERRHNSAY